MTLPTLPENAFLPKRPLNEQEMQSFITRRNRMFSLCTPVEQQCLSELAEWYATIRLEFMSKPNLFSQSHSVWFNHRYFPWANPKPNPIVIGLSKVHELNFKAERWIGARAQQSLITRLLSLFNETEIYGLGAVIHFLRQLPIEFDADGIEERLDGLMREWLASNRVPAAKRFDVLLGCLAWLYEDKGYGADDAKLRKQAWPLLLEIAENDLPYAVSLVDEHWAQTRSPEILMTLHLYEQPELAYKLAVKFKPYRTDFASDMLRVSIFYASFQLKKLDQTMTKELDMVMDTSCQLLAQWTLDRSWTSSQSALQSLDRLFSFGDPLAVYWHRLTPEGLAILKELPLKELDQKLSLLAKMVFYNENSAHVGEVFELYKTCVQRRLSVRGDWDSIRDTSQSLSILEDKVLSMRNRRVSANPNHPLLQWVNAQLQDLLNRLLTSEPASGLSNIVSLMLALTNESLARKYHQTLRDEFEARARKYPTDAGVALKSLIQYCGFSQLDDEMYRRNLCKESFDYLLPLLESISSTDATVARTGIGWNPRGDI
jgi:hypothetical protein